MWTLLLAHTICIRHAPLQLQNSLIPFTNPIEYYLTPSQQPSDQPQGNGWRMVYAL